MSIINRHNYEEYFLLYIDDELTAAERQAVEEFLNVHQDLKMELEMLQQSTLKAEHIVFHEKDLLLKNTSSMINADNYEEYFVLYADDELTNEQKDSVEQFVYRNPKYQAEFELIQKARVEPDRHVVFADKTLLYRSEEEEEKEKIFVLGWWKMAAAAIVLIFLSGLGWYIVSTEKTTPAIVNNKPPQKPQLPVTPEKQQNTESLVKVKPEVSDAVSPDGHNPIASKKEITKENTINTIGKKVKQTPERMLTNTQAPEKDITGRNIQVATNVTTKRPEVSAGKIEMANSMALQNNKEIIDEAVGPIEANEYAYTASNDQVEILNTTISKKNKLRGLFRKVSRVVEKTTTINPGDVKGIRIANFEIELK